MKESLGYRMYGVYGGNGDRDLWMEMTHTDEIGREGIFGQVGNDMEFAMAKAYYNLKSWFKDFISFLLQVLYEAAALCINTIRTFNLLILAIIGPIVLGLSIFDGFQHSLTVYLARYVNYYLWLPIANILGSMLGKIQEGMIELDRSQINQHGDSFFTTTDIGYIVFMIIGIVSYFTIPSIANMIVNAGGGSSLVSKVTNMTFGTAAVATGCIFCGRRHGRRCPGRCKPADQPRIFRPGQRRWIFQRQSIRKKIVNMPRKIPVTPEI